MNGGTRYCWFHSWLLNQLDITEVETLVLLTVSCLMQVAQLCKLLSCIPLQIFSGADLEKGAQRFLRKSGKANLRFLLSVYRAIIRLKSITEALADVIKDVPEMDGARATEIQYSDQHMIHSAEGIGAFKEKSVTGKQLVRDRVFVPLNKVRGMRE